MRILLAAFASGTIDSVSGSPKEQALKCAEVHMKSD